MSEEKEKVDILEDEPQEVSKKQSKGKLESEIKILKEENEKLFREKDELNNKYLLSLAEQKNYKKRLDEEMERFYKYASFDVCKEIVQILDSFDMALDKNQKNEEMKAYLEGFKMTRNQIFNVLNKQGVTEIESLGKEFDPNTMVAVAVMEDKNKKDQEVLNVFMKGYMFKDRVLRPANVIVNQINEENPQEELDKDLEKDTKEE